MRNSIGLEGTSQSQNPSQNRGGFGSLNFPIMDTPISVECGREVRFRRSSLRTLVECMVPGCCGGGSIFHQQSLSESTTSLRDTDNSTTIVTATFFGYRRGRVSFCIQGQTRSLKPLLLLELAVPTSYLAREMKHGLLRMVLEYNRDRGNYYEKDHDHKQSHHEYFSLYDVPVWSMYCNGRKVGFAVRRQMTARDLTVLRLMQSVSVGAGVLPVESKSSHHDQDGEQLIMYLRASFQRITGSAHCESFHMINPVGSTGQELSVFLLRS